MMKHKVCKNHKEELREPNPGTNRLHLDFRDPRVLELYPQLWGNISAKNTSPLFLLLHKVTGVLLNPTNEALKEALNDTTRALSLFPNNEALRNAQDILLDRLRQASISPFKEDPKGQEEFNMLFDYIDKNGRPMDNGPEVMDREKDTVLPEACEPSDLPEDVNRALEWEAERDAEQVAEWLAELDAAIEEYLRLYGSDAQ